MSGWLVGKSPRAQHDAKRYHLTKTDRQSNERRRAIDWWFVDLDFCGRNTVCGIRFRRTLKIMACKRRRFRIDLYGLSSAGGVSISATATQIGHHAMFHFTIRDVLWLTAIAGVSLTFGLVVLRANQAEEFAATFGFFVYGACCYAAGRVVGQP